MTNGIPLRLLAAMLAVAACGRGPSEPPPGSDRVAALVDESTHAAAAGKPVRTARPLAPEKCGDGSKRWRYEVAVEVGAGQVDTTMNRLYRHWGASRLEVTRLPKDKLVKASDGTFAVAVWYGAPDGKTIHLSGTSPCGKR